MNLMHSNKEKGSVMHWGSRVIKNLTTLRALLFLFDAIIISSLNSDTYGIRMCMHS